MNDKQIIEALIAEVEGLYEAADKISVQLGVPPIPRAETLLKLAKAATTGVNRDELEQQSFRVQRVANEAGPPAD